MKLFSNINFNKLKEGLAKTRDKLVNKIVETVSGKAKLDEEILEELEDVLLSSDLGFDTTEKVINNTKIKLKSIKDRSQDSILNTIQEELTNILLENYKGRIENEIDKFKPYVILIVGVNGVGKTTTIGKLAHNFKKSGLDVLIGSADTFRAAANEQLEIWAKRAGVEVINGNNTTDPSAVVFNTLQAAVKRKADVVIIDTAGRLHTKQHLMEELRKIDKVIKKVVDYGPNETFLILDGTTGQNAVIQSENFNQVTKLSGVIITKLDGTAKGGVIFQVSSKFNLPIRYIGVGEGIEDLQDFDPKLFVSALFSKT
ncbi:MAG: signal recognition particle-docking protein FtsY [Ignavibacteriales bacterium]|nr:MAG: signal recognition particle-docking protein FtsY [Ignavibacteriales bacterium]